MREGNLIFGAVTGVSPPTFTTAELPDCDATPAGRDFAVRAQAKIEVPLVCDGFGGVSFGPFYVAACTTAMYDCELGRPRLIWVKPENYTCVVP